MKKQYPVDIQVFTNITRSTRDKIHREVDGLLLYLLDTKIQDRIRHDIELAVDERVFIELIDGLDIG